MAFGLFEAAVTSEQEVRIARQASQDKMNAAVYDVREKLGPFLFAARDLGEFRDRVALCKNDQSLYKIIEAHLPPITGTVRRIAGKNSVLEKEFRRRQAGGSVPGLGGGGATSEDDRPTSVLDGSPLASPSDAGIPSEYAGWDKSKQSAFNGEVKTKSTFKPSDDELIPEANWESYRNKVDQNSSKVKRNFTSSDDSDDFSLLGPSQGATLTGQEDDSFQGTGPKKASSLQVAMYRDWCEANDYSPIRLSSLDAYATNLDDDDYLKLASAVQEWEHEHKPKTPKGQSKEKLKDVTRIGPDTTRGKGWGSGGGGYYAARGDDFHLALSTQNGGGLLSPTDAADDVADPVSQQDMVNQAKENSPNWAMKSSRVAGEHSLENYPRDEPRFHLDERYHPRRYNDPTGLPEDYDQAVTDESGARRYPELPHHAPKHEASRDPLRAYTAWCKANGLKRISARNVEYFAGNDPQLAYHLALRIKRAIHAARQRQAYNNVPSDPECGYCGATSHGTKAHQDHISEQEGGTHWNGNHAEPKDEWKKNYEARRRWADSYTHIDSNPGMGGWPSDSSDTDRSKTTTPAATPAAPSWPSTKAPADKPNDVSDSEAYQMFTGYRHTAAPDYLQKADDALTQLLNQKAEEFQQTIAPLQQALVTVQQAEQMQQQSNPLNVQPPAGTVNVLPQPPGQGQDPSAALGGPAGGDPMAAAAALAGMGAPGGGGGMPTDQGGPPPAAADQGALPPDPQQLQARRRQAGESVEVSHIPECDICKYDHGKSGVPAAYDGKTKMGPWANMCEQHFKSHGVGLGTGAGQRLVHRGRRGGHPKGEAAMRPHTAANVYDLWQQWRNSPDQTHRGGDVDYEAFARQFGLGQRAINKLRQQHARRRYADDGVDSSGGFNPNSDPSQRPPSNSVGQGGTPPPVETPPPNPPPNIVPPGPAQVSPWPVYGTDEETKTQMPGIGGSIPGMGFVNSIPGMGLQQHGSNHYYDPDDEEQIFAPSHGYGWEHESGPSGPPYVRPQSSERHRHEARRKQAWSGWGPAQFPRTREVTGWNWDSHLEGYLANRPQRFACACGDSFDTPTGFHRCACGKQWNSYVIGTGGSNREAAAEKYLVREIPVRENVIVANRKLASEGIPLSALQGNKGDEVHRSDCKDLKNPRYINDAYDIGPHTSQRSAVLAFYDPEIYGYNPDNPSEYNSFARGIKFHNCTKGLAKQGNRPHDDPYGYQKMMADPSYQPLDTRQKYIDYSNAQKLPMVPDWQLDAWYPKESAIYKLDEPGELQEGEEDGLPTIVTPPKDWHRRDKNQRWTKSELG